MQFPKSRWRSRTLWFNATAAVVALVSLFAEAIEIPEVRAIIPTGIAAYVLGAVAVSNLWLRTKTTQPVK